MDVKQPALSTSGQENWRELPVGYWFFSENEICTHRYSVQERTSGGCILICSTPWHHKGAVSDMQEIATSHNERISHSPAVQALESQWIRVEDKLPEYDEQYLCHLIWDDGPDYEVCKFSDGKFWSYGDATDKVTHWQVIAPVRRNQGNDASR